MVRQPARLRELLAETKLLDTNCKNVAAGEIIINEGDEANSFGMVVEGFVTLFRYVDTTKVELHTYERNEFFGALSFFLDRKHSVSMEAKTDCTILEINQEKFIELKESCPELFDILQVNILYSLSRRFAGMSELHANLHRNHQQQIQQEKMITLGKLLSGITHEINNPLGALIRSLEHLEQTMKALWKTSHLEQLEDHFYGGMNALPIAAQESRDRYEFLLERHEDVPTGCARTFSRGQEEYFNKFVVPDLLSSNYEELGMKQKAFEIGAIFKSISLSANQIQTLVKGIKKSVKIDKGEKTEVDLQMTISETLIILQNVLTNIEVTMLFDELPTVMASGSELCNVWTNIIINASEAMDGKGKLIIDGSYDRPSNIITLRISDTGPGIPDEILPRVFETNFTTKNSSKKFGLGLGMAFSKSVIQKNGGTIHAENYEDGARFVVRLPAKLICYQD